MPQTTHRPLTAAGLVLALSLSLGACADAARPTDPAQAFGPQARPVTFQVRVAQHDALPAGFVEEYHRRGRGPMTIVVPAAAGPDAEAAAQTLAAGLRGQLVPASIGRATADSPQDSGTLHVFFRAYVAVVPECGDWSGKPWHGVDLTNRPEANFGCAYYRNIGMMLSDPGELLAAPATGPADTPRVVDAINRHRTGASVGAQIPTGELTTIQVER